MNQHGLLINTGEFLGDAYEIVVECYGGLHSRLQCTNCNIDDGRLRT